MLVLGWNPKSGKSFLTEELKVYAIDTTFYLLPNVDRLLCQTRISAIHTQRDLYHPKG